MIEYADKSAIFGVIFPKSLPSSLKIPELTHQTSNQPPLNMNSRRRFLLKLAASAPVAAGSLLFGQAPPPPPVKLEESDPVATALGYKTDATKVDSQKYPQHKADQICSGCALFIAKPGEDFGACSAFGGKLVANKGWCAAYAKKP